tara:strand:+ start:679 stop:966 length:288 start_codon:yes stop_codon:yes gene_type:complete
MAKSKEVTLKSKIITSGNKLKKAGKKVLKKTTAEQRFLGKTLPRYIGKAAKFAFTNPITATGLFLVPSAIKAIGKQKGIKFSEMKQYDRKGRKFL